MNCCRRSAGGSPSLHECLERGLRTRRALPLPVVGTWVETPQAMRARFSLAIHDNTLTEARFEATPCATLVAYCEALAEHEAGRGLGEVPSLDAAGLVALLKGVPPGRQDRAVIAVAALRAAILSLPQESDA